MSKAERRFSQQTTNNKAGEGDVNEEGIVEVLPEHREVTMRYPSPTKLFWSEADIKGHGLGQPLGEIDSKTPHYEEILKYAEKLVSQGDEESIVHLVNDSLVHPTVLLRLFEKYTDKQIHPTDEFIKLADVLTELGQLNYPLDEKLTNKNWARYYSTLKKTELLLQDRENRKYGNKTNEEILKMMKDEGITQAEKDASSNELFTRQSESKNKTVKEIAGMVENGKIDKSVLEKLREEYEGGRNAPEDIKKKVKSVLDLID